MFSVHLKQEEKLTVRCGRNGGVENLEVQGMIMLRVKSEDYGRIIVAVDNKESRGVQLQVSIVFYLTINSKLAFIRRLTRISIRSYLQTSP